MLKKLIKLLNSVIKKETEGRRGLLERRVPERRIRQEIELYVILIKTHYTRACAHKNVNKYYKNVSPLRKWRKFYVNRAVFGIHKGSVRI